MSYALVTGGSGGIGLSIAKNLASRGYNILLISRSKSKLSLCCDHLKEHYNILAYYKAIDLTDEDAIRRLVSWITEHSWSLEVLVNNAGYAIWGDFRKTNIENTCNMMKLNMTSLVMMCHNIIPLFQRNKKSYILNISSTTAYQAIPYLSIYAATKSFVLSFTRGLRWELKKQHISVSCLSPGATTTGFMDRANMDALKKKAERVSMHPDEVANIAMKGMFNEKIEIVPGAINKLSAGLSRMLPKSILEKVAYGIYKQ